MPARQMSRQGTPAKEPLKVIAIKMAIPPYDDKLRLESGNVIEGAVKESLLETWLLFGRVNSYVPIY